MTPAFPVEVTDAWRAAGATTIRARRTWLIATAQRDDVKQRLARAVVPIRFARLGCPTCIDLVAVADEAIDSDWVAV